MVSICITEVERRKIAVFWLSFMNVESVFNEHCLLTVRRNINIVDQHHSLSFCHDGI